MLVKSPLFSIIAITTLALGIGLNAATFSAIHGLLLRPLGGVASPEELVQVYRQWPGIIYGSNSIPHYQDVRDRSDEVFESTAAWFFSPMSLSADGRSERILGVVASANLLQTYGVVPALGRPFLPGEEDGSPGAHAVTFLGHSFWQARFGGDPGVIGRTIDINGRPFVIVGVAPPAFKGPMAVLDVPLYVPIMMQAEIMPGNNLLESRGNNMMNVVARLRDGKTFDHAQQMMDAMLLQLQEELPDSYEGQRGTTLVYQSESGIHPSFRNAQVGMSSVMMAVVSLLLLIACVNVANLFLARARERRREMGIRMSMGAGRGRILQQLFTESVVFSLLAGLAGVGLAYLVTGILSRVQLPIDGPFDFKVGIDNTVLLFTLAVSIAAGLIFGLAPALQAARSDLVTAMRGESSQTGGRSRVSGGLVVLQMALSIILLISSGLFIRALKSATEIDPGMDAPKNLVMASLDPGLQGLDEPQTRQFYDRLAEELAARPNVTAVGFTNSVPLGFSNSDRGVDIPGYEILACLQGSRSVRRKAPRRFRASVLRSRSARRTVERREDTGGQLALHGSRRVGCRRTLRDFSWRRLRRGAPCLRDRRETSERSRRLAGRQPGARRVVRRSVRARRDRRESSRARGFEYVPQRSSRRSPRVPRRFLRKRSALVHPLRGYAGRLVRSG